MSGPPGGGDIGWKGIRGGGVRSLGGGGGRGGELMIGDKWFCEWEWRTEGRRRRGEVSYSPPEQTLHVS